MNTYTIQTGDSLESIAQSIFGDVSMASFLASINSIQFVNGAYQIKPGMTINTSAPGVEAKKKLPWAWIVGSTVTAASIIYWRDDIRRFFKSTF